MAKHVIHSPKTGADLARTEFLVADQLDDSPNLSSMSQDELDEYLISVFSHLEKLAYTNGALGRNIFGKKARELRVQSVLGIYNNHDDTTPIPQNYYEAMYLFMQSLDYLKESFDIDYLQDREALDTISGRRHVGNAIATMLDDRDKCVEFNDDPESIVITDIRKYQLNDYALDILTSYISSDHLLDEAIHIHNDILNDTSPEEREKSEPWFSEQLKDYEFQRDNIDKVKESNHKILQELASDNMRKVVEFIQSNLPDYDTNVVESEILSSVKQELDFDILPPGTSLRELAEQTIDCSEYKKIEIDLRRIKVLEDLREEFGKDKCYFAKGKKRGSSLVDPKTDLLIDEDFIVLVIQKYDDHLNIMGEDAIAISPFARKHAGYLVRSDYGAGNWREILSLTKADARSVGARALKFDKVSGADKYDAYIEKVKALFGCRAEEFGYDYHLSQRKDGGYYLKKNKARGIVRLTTETLSVPRLK